MAANPLERPTHVRTPCMRVCLHLVATPHACNTWWCLSLSLLLAVPSTAAPGPGTPFPDPADPADASAASALPPERFAYLPPWLANTHGFGPHNAGGAGWYADALNGGRAAAAATHLHAGLPPGGWGLGGQERWRGGGTSRD